MSDEDVTQIMAAVRAFIGSTIAVGAKFSDGEDLYEAGILDSMGVRDLVSFLEDTYAIQIPEASFFDKRFATLHGMATITSELRAKR